MFCMWGKDRLFHSSFQIIHHLFPLGARFIRRIARGTVGFIGQIACKWLFCLCGIAWKNMVGIGRGGACVPARVAPQGRIRRSIPRTQCAYFWYGNAAARTFGRAHRHRPYGFVWVDCVWMVLFVGKTVHMNQHHRCCTFVSPGLPTIGGYPGERRRERTYAIGIVLFLINFRMGKSFTNNPFAVCGNDVR